VKGTEHNFDLLYYFLTEVIETADYDIYKKYGDLTVRPYPVPADLAYLDHVISTVSQLKSQLERDFGY
jgi:hypothetical protein